MKIISHNVNGINAYKNNGKLDKLLEFNADVYCLQEVRCNNEEKVLSIFGDDIANKYKIYTHINDERKGYAGVATLVKKETMGNLLIAVDIPKFSSPNLTNVSKGRIITLYFTNCIIINLYSINSSGKKNERIAYEQLFNAYIKKLNQDFHLPIIIAGDLNVCAKDIDYYGDFKKDYNTAPAIYDFEIAAFNNLINENKLIDSFRFCNNDKVKYSIQYSKVKRKTIASRLDYILVDSRIQRYIQSANIYEDFCEYDHKPIDLNINLPISFK